MYFKDELLVVRGITRKHKFVIGYRAGMFALALLSTVGAFYAQRVGLEQYISATVDVYSNARLGTLKYFFVVPVCEWWTYIGTSLATWYGIRTIFALVFHPIVGTSTISMPANEPGRAQRHP